MASIGPLEIVPIDGFRGYYVGSTGHVYSIKSGEFRQRPDQYDQDGYAHTTLMRDSKSHTIKIQRLVASHFLGPKPSGTVVCHRDGNKKNNAVDNLKYATQRENIADIYRHGHENPPRGSMNGMSRLTEADVLMMRQLRAETGISHGALGRRFGISREQARDIVNRRYWKHV